MNESPPPIEVILDLLASGPARIAELTAELTDEQVHTNPGFEEWSANAVLAHLRACSDVWGSCITRILVESEPTFRAVSPRSWIRKTNYLDQSFRQSLKAFSDQRSGLVAVLERLTPEDWSRTATVKAVGRVLERSVYSYAKNLGDHEQEHVVQIEQIVESLKSK